MRSTFFSLDYTRKDVSQAYGMKFTLYIDHQLLKPYLDKILFCPPHPMLELSFVPQLNNYFLIIFADQSVSYVGLPFTDINLSTGMH